MADFEPEPPDITNVSILNEQLHRAGRVNIMASAKQADILNGLNDAQCRAVISKADTVAILAGPGSGKTHTLTSRVTWLIQCAGYQPADVIVATFTVKAAREMKERICKNLGEEAGRKIVLGTFHSVARRYLSKYGTRIGLDAKFGIADDGDSRAIIQRICKRLSLGIEPAAAKAWISKRKAKGNSSQVAKARGGTQPKDPPGFLECFTEYQDHLARSNLLDYDDLLVKGVELLQQHPSCVSNVQAVLIDEYQDTNGIQYELMKLFASAKERITVVGDPDQSIYGWRSAEIRNLYRLLREFPKTEEVSLEENYRSSQSILNVSLDVIKQDTKRYKKVLIPVHNKGTKPVLRKLKSSAAEGDWVVSEIRRVITMFAEALEYQDIAILLRSASLSRHIEHALGKAGISYRMIGGHKFYERKEIKVLLDYLRVANQPDINDAVARIMNVPRRGIGDTTVKSLLEEAETAQLSLWAVISKHCKGVRTASTTIRPKMEAKLNTELIRTIDRLRSKASQMSDSSPFTLINLVEQLIEDLDFKKHLETEFPEDHEQRWSNVQEFIGLAGDFMRDFGGSDEEELPEIKDVDQAKAEDVLSRFLANVALASDAQTETQDANEKKSLVTISTIHAAKGLEWPVVFIPSVYEGSMPHSRSDDQDEERRLLYVAMTRAKALLYLSFPFYGSQGGGNKLELSSFVSPLPSNTFLQQGVSFDKSVLESVTKILGRNAPSEKRVFGKMPLMFSPEDNLFPIEPFSDADADGVSKDNRSDYGRASKRQRIGANEDGAESEEHWKRGYSTTMEQSSGFTMAAMPSFVTAGQHHAAATAEEVTQVAAVRGKRQQLGRAGSLQGQSNLAAHGFIRQISMDSRVIQPKSKDFTQRRHEAAASRSLARSVSVAEKTNTPHIEPALSNHKLASGKPAYQPPVLAAGSDAGPRKRYANFSSSPTRPASPKENKAPEEEQEPVQDRPARSFHATTFMAVGGSRGIRRPVAMGAAPSIERLRKPFKPLTINRPQGMG